MKPKSIEPIAKRKSWFMEESKIEAMLHPGLADERRRLMAERDRKGVNNMKKAIYQELLHQVECYAEHLSYGTLHYNEIYEGKLKNLVNLIHRAKGNN